MKNNSSANEIQDLKNKIKELEALVKHYEELFKLSQKRKFGASSEKSLYDQLTIEGETDETAVVNPEAEEEPPLEVVKEHHRKKRTRKDGLPKDLPVEEIICELPDEEKICPNCNSQTETLGNEYREELTVIPARVMLRRFVLPTYICRKCEANSKCRKCEEPSDCNKCENAPNPAVVIKTKAPNPVIKGSFASPESVAYTAHQKFCSARFAARNAALRASAFFAVLNGRTSVQAGARMDAQGCFIAAANSSELAYFFCRNVVVLSYR
ncbi:MAG: IS66 family transposase zinc-finger binding domain-containing protein [Oscillospiraceae bacterium]|nr:IS66 family transposase zinc-finger binding domain-containing protein [Oscillospiraceae bacterium]